MDLPSYAIGQAVFIRTDQADYEEEMVPFRTLDELVRLCTTLQAGRMLERVIIFSLVNGEPHAVTLGFLSATKGQRPDQAHPMIEE
ncbi:MAG TPA: hypothetical protein P5186_09305 [Candidatus Paceibacterota bacterium]|nr:hypothetical protein [Verrucomicrobiota bacterium]HRY48231.1 hypothetical protein [Candidatus Paceibacterota bacterium]HSA00250.1 hypothetical protein [Candidatus Paceibacterota bacterium]